MWPAVGRRSLCHTPRSLSPLLDSQVESVFYLVDQVGVEPTTFRLKVCHAAGCVTDPNMAVKVGLEPTTRLSPSALTARPLLPTRVLHIKFYAARSPCFPGRHVPPQGDRHTGGLA